MTTMKTQTLKSDVELLNLYDDFLRYAINNIEYFFQNEYKSVMRKYVKIKEKEKQLSFVSLFRKKDIEFICTYHIGRHKDICPILYTTREVILTDNFLSDYLKQRGYWENFRDFYLEGKNVSTIIRSDMKYDNFVNVSVIFDSDFVRNYEGVFIQPEILNKIPFDFEYKNFTTAYIYQLYVNVDKINFYQFNNPYNRYKSEDVYIYYLLEMLKGEKLFKYGGIPSHTLTEDDVVYVLPYK